MATAPLLAIDWGSSSLRGALIDRDGGVLDERSSARGLLNLGADGFEATLLAEFGDWLAEPEVRCLMAGMVGSRQGWVEAPYLPCPAGLDEFASHLQRVVASASAAPRDIAIVPGATCEHDGAPDVLRGEEVKFFGAMALLDVASATMLSPGTHSKWARIEDGRLTRFATTMSGEFYALLRRHSILARSLPDDDGELDRAAFDAGVERSLAGGGLMQSAFSVRSIELLGRLPRASLPSYLSGLVLGDAVGAAELAGADPVVVIGAPALTERFARALSRRGIQARILGEEAAWRGLWAIDRRRLEHAAQR